MDTLKKATLFLLKELEWGSSPGFSFCPKCGGNKATGHGTDCELWSLIQELKPKDKCQCSKLARIVQELSIIVIDGASEDDKEYAQDMADKVALLLKF